jgi:hypothetical protein
MRSKVSAVVALALALVTVSVSAQSLGDVAKEEAARRKAVAKPGKTYTNESLKPVEPAETPAVKDAPAATPPAGASADKPAADQKPADGASKGEAYWKDRLQKERDTVSRGELFAESLQTRINALTTDFVNRDDPAQRAQIANDRDRALAELERVKKEIADHKKAIADIQEEGRKAGVPAAWLR